MLLFSLRCLALFEQIIPEKCRYDVLSTKVEIRLAKAEPIHWTSLEFSGEVAVTQRVNLSSGKLITLAWCLYRSGYTSLLLLHAISICLFHS